MTDKLTQTGARPSQELSHSLCQEQIIINTNKYFVEIIDEGRSTIGYTVVFPEKLLTEIMKQNKQLARKTQECEELRQMYKSMVELCESKDEAILEKQADIDELKRKIFEFEKAGGIIDEGIAWEGQADRYRKALEEIQTLTGKIISNDDQPACVMDTECPLNGGVGFDNHCNENCPLISAKQILDIINKAKEEE